MTKTTDSRQVRLLIQGILSKHGIDNFQLELDLAGAVKRYYEETSRRGSDKVLIREKILEGMRIAAQKASQREKLYERVKTCLGFDASLPRFDMMIAFLERKEEMGETLEGFRKWWDHEDPYKRPALWKIADRLKLSGTV